MRDTPARKTKAPAAPTAFLTEPIALPIDVAENTPHMVTVRVPSVVIKRRATLFPEPFHVASTRPLIGVRDFDRSVRRQCATTSALAFNAFEEFQAFWKCALAVLARFPRYAVSIWGHIHIFRSGNALKNAAFNWSRDPGLKTAPTYFHHVSPSTCLRASRSLSSSVRTRIFGRTDLNAASACALTFATDAFDSSASTLIFAFAAFAAALSSVFAFSNDDLSRVASTSTLTSRSFASTSRRIFSTVPSLSLAATSNSGGRRFQRCRIFSTCSRSCLENLETSGMTDRDTLPTRPFIPAIPDVPFPFSVCDYAQSIESFRESLRRRLVLHFDPRSSLVGVDFQFVLFASENAPEVRPKHAYLLDYRRQGGSLRPPVLPPVVLPHVLTHQRSTLPAEPFHELPREKVPFGRVDHGYLEPVESPQVSGQVGGGEHDTPQAPNSPTAPAYSIANSIPALGRPRKSASKSAGRSAALSRTHS